MSVFLNALKAIYAAANLINGLVAFLRDRQQIKAGEDAAAARSLKEQVTRAEKALAARRAVVPGRLPDHDPDRRD
jgi:hypothetical protein